MKLTDFISDVGRPVAYYPGLKKITKSTTATILLCQLIYWTGKQADPEGWIYKTSADLEEETGLSYDEQATARKQLVKLGYIEEVYHRLDHQMAFRIMANAINTDWGIGDYPIPESRNTALGKAVLPDSLIESENTAQNTTESSTPDAFSGMVNAIQQVTGLPPFGQESIKAVTELVEMKATKDDIKAAYNWLLEQGKQFRYYHTLVGPTRTAQAKRMAKPIGSVYDAPPEVGNKPIEIIPQPATRMESPF